MNVRAAMAIITISSLALLLLYGGANSRKLEQAVGIAGPTQQKAIPDISKTPPSRRPTRDRLLTKLIPEKPESTFEVINSIEADRALALNCHEIAHDIGHRAYELYGFDGALRFSDATRLEHPSVLDICAGGYVHGVLEEASLHEEDFTEHPGIWCDTLSGETRAGCFHGVGHALMFSYQRDTVSSLDGCRRAGTRADTVRCFEGVWMEFFWGSAAYTDSGALGWDAKAPLQPCIDTSPDARGACFIYAAFGYLRIHPHDYAGAVRACTTPTLTENDSASCLKGVGITMVSHYKAHQLERSAVYAKDLSAQQKKGFYRGVFGYARLSGVAPAELAASCSSLSGEDNAACTASLALQ